MSYAAHKGDPAKHPHLAMMPPEKAAEYTVLDYNQDYDQPPPSTAGTYRVMLGVHNNADDFDLDLLNVDPRLTEAAWAFARGIDGLTPQQRRQTALRYMGQHQAANKKAAAPSGAMQHTPVTGFATVATSPVPVAGNGYANGESARPVLFANGDQPAVQPPPVEPPRVQVDIHLDGARQPLTYYYHQAYAEGGWLRLVLDERYPGTARFPVDYQERQFTVAVAGEPTAFLVHAAGNQMQFGHHTISSLIIEDRLPLER